LIEIAPPRQLNRWAAMELLDTIRTAWAFTGIVPREVLDINAFGNVLVEDEHRAVWRISPEMLSCERIASSRNEFTELLTSPDFKRGWEMERLVNIATSALGTPPAGRCFCFKIPTVLGGLYERDNIGTISLAELISFAGDLGSQIKDLPDGTKVRFVVK
jgi:hypothetical protein